MEEGEKDRIIRHKRKASKEPKSLEKEIFKNKERVRELELEKRQRKFLRR